MPHKKANDGAEAAACSLLAVDDKASMRRLLEAAFSDQGFTVTTASCGEEAVALLKHRHFDVVITDLAMPGLTGMDVLRAAKGAGADTEVIIITAYGTIETAVEAMRLGAHDFITKPFKLDEIEAKVRRILRGRETQPENATGGWPMRPVGGSPQTRQMVRMIEKIAPSRSSVLITGPSGVGKEIVARAIHHASPRAGKPFVALNCAALAPGVLESELFGHEKGAFTGAGERRIGRFEQAHTGTLFLDEVGEIGPAVQAKLLRVLQEGEFERVGGNTTIKVDVRILAATNRALNDAIGRGDFREDFYYRLKVFSIEVPPLRERPDDIPLLVEHFLRKFSAELGRTVDEVDDDVVGLFMRYPWPGNVRELQNVLERAVVLAETNHITREELPPELLDAMNRPQPGPAARPCAARADLAGAAAPASPGEIIQAADPPVPDAPSFLGRTEQLERELIQGALDRFRWNKSKAAGHLGLKRTTLQYKIKKYGLE